MKFLDMCEMHPSYMAVPS